eukprot:921696-Pyramimonas_sp.AAC.1
MSASLRSHLRVFLGRRVLRLRGFARGAAWLLVFEHHSSRRGRTDRAPRVPRPGCGRTGANYFMA